MIYELLAERLGETLVLQIFAAVFLLIFFYFLLFEWILALIGTTPCSGVVIKNMPHTEKTTIFGVGSIDEVDYVYHLKIEIIYKGKRKVCKTHFSKRKKLKEGDNVQVFYHPKRKDVVLLDINNLLFRIAIFIFLVLAFLMAPRTF